MITRAIRCKFRLFSVLVQLCDSEFLVCLFYAGDLVGAVHLAAVSGCLWRAEAALLHPERLCHGQGEDGRY